eukprot:UN14756
MISTEKTESIWQLQAEVGLIEHGNMNVIKRLKENLSEAQKECKDLQSELHKIELDKNNEIHKLKLSINELENNSIDYTNKVKRLNENITELTTNVNNLEVNKKEKETKNT